jgi:hypothetical protein
MLPVSVLTQIVIVVSFFLTVANIVAYGVLAPWYRSRPGRWLFILLNGLAATLGLVAFRILFGDFEYRAELVLVTFALYIGAMLYLLATIVREQVGGASRRRRLLDDTSNKEKP